MSNLDVTHHTITANGIRQHFVEAGEGAPVVLLHGFPETYYAWRHQIPSLALPQGDDGPQIGGASYSFRRSRR